MTLGGGTAPSVVVSSTELGGLAYANFNGTTQYLTSASTFAISQPFTVFAVAKYIESTNLNRFMFDGYTATDQRAVLYRPGGGATANVGSNIGAGVNGTFSWASYSGFWRLWDIHFIGSTVSSVASNGSVLGTGDCGSGAGSGIRGFTFGCRCDGVPASYGWSGAIARIVIFTRDVNGTDLTNIRNYFRTRYAIY